MRISVKSLIRTRTLLLITGAGVVMFGCWCGAAYLRLEQLQVAVGDARARLRSAERRRIDLSRNLVRDTDGLACLTEIERARLLSAAASLEQSMLRAETLSADPDGYGRFLEARSHLERGLQSTWPTLGESGAEAAGWLLESTKPSVESAAIEAAIRLDRFDRAVEAYDRERRRFPGSLVASIGRANAVDRGGMVRAGDGRR